MKLTSIKTAAETGIAGVEFVYTDKAITEIVIGKLRIRKGESYSSALQVLIETPFERVERYKLTASIEGFPDAVSFHESDYDAKIAGAKLEDKGATFHVEKLTVEIDEAGGVVGYDAKVEAVEPDLAIPF